MKQQFRSKDGCCICATKSSTTRFQPSTDYEAGFLAVFGPKARQRTGSICNACILCVKRGSSGTSKQTNKPAQYANVVDSRKGTGPKHMKQICKRNRRRELREAAAKAITANKQLAMGSSAAAAAAAESSDYNDRSGSTISSNSNSNSGAGSYNSSSNSSNAQGIDSSASGFGHSDCLSVNGSGCSGDKSLSSSMIGGGVGLVGAGGSSSVAGGSGTAGVGAAATSTPSGGLAEFRAPMAPPTSERQHYYKKRVIMKPIKTPDSQQEISDLFDAVIRSRKLNPSEGPLSVQQVHSAFLNTKRRRMMAANNGSETASVGSTEPPESFTSDTGSSDTTRSSSAQRL